MSPFVLLPDVPLFDSASTPEGPNVHSTLTSGFVLNASGRRMLTGRGRHPNVEKSRRHRNHISQM